MTEVVLSPSEFEVAATVGVRRQAEALRRNLPDKSGLKGASVRGKGRLDLHLMGACGEAAFAKAFDRFWGGSNLTFRSSPDVAGLEVRTRSRHDYELIVRGNDADDKAYVLVTCEDDQLLAFWIRGWKLGRDAKREEWRKAHGGRDAEFFVPHVHLDGF